MKLCTESVENMMSGESTEIYVRNAMTGAEKNYFSADKPHIKIPLMCWHVLCKKWVQNSEH